jgi:hypothetical protein
LNVDSQQFGLQRAVNRDAAYVNVLPTANRQLSTVNLARQADSPELKAKS